MRYDCHIHTHFSKNEGDSKYGPTYRFNTEAYLDDLKKANIDGSAIFSLSPIHYPDISVEERMNAALDICNGNDNLFPFFWIDPTEEDALMQIDLAVQKGFVAFKMIPSTYNVACQKSMDVIEKIASKGKSILFHSGICWDGMNSAANHKPANYEALIEIPKLKFCLAHVSWPWYDECIAVYGKFNNAYFTRPETSCEMFIDVTPGTPEVYREEVFRHLLCSGYELRYNLMFGTDCNTGNYNHSWSSKWQKIDNELYDRFIEHDVEDFKEHIYGKNFMRFIGLSDEEPVRTIPMVGE